MYYIHIKKKKKTIKINKIKRQNAKISFTTTISFFHLNIIDNIIIIYSIITHNSVFALYVLLLFLI